MCQIQARSAEWCSMVYHTVLHSSLEFFILSKQILLADLMLIYLSLFFRYFPKQFFCEVDVKILSVLHGLVLRVWYFIFRSGFNFMIVSWIYDVSASDSWSGAKSIGGSEEEEEGQCSADCWFGSYSPFTLQVMIAVDAGWDIEAGGAMSVRVDWLGVCVNRPAGKEALLGSHYPTLGNLITQKDIFDIRHDDFQITNLTIVIFSWEHTLRVAEITLIASSQLPKMIVATKDFINAKIYLKTAWSKNCAQPYQDSNHFLQSYEPTKQNCDSNKLFYLNVQGVY